MCDSCGCLLPSQSHGDKRNLLHSRVIKGDLTAADYLSATESPQGPKTVAQVKANIRKTENAIKQGKLSPAKRMP